MMNTLVKDSDQTVIREMLENKKVLIVDDDDDYAEALDEVFSLQGSRVTRITDPVSALGCVLSGNYDLIIVDKNMPRIDGLEFAEKVRENKPSSKIVLITAYPDEYSRRRSLDIGVRYYLSKPFRKNDILEACSFLFL